MKLRISNLGLVASMSLLALLLASPMAAEDFRVIVNEQNPLESIERGLLDKIFLSKVVRWENGSSIQPVNLSEGSPIRNVFCLQVHRRPDHAVAAYWLKQVYSGRSVPPPEFDSETEAVARVTQDRGAIAYVSASLALPEGVRELKVTGLGD